MAPATADAAGSGTAADSGLWVLAPQAMSRLSAVCVFAVAAARLDADSLGVLAVATALAAGSSALAPAVVGKPLAFLTTDVERERTGPMALSFAVLSAVLTGIALAVAGLASTGALRSVLLLSALGVPAAMAVESEYWRSVFLYDRRRAGLTVCGAFLFQAAAVTVAALTLPDSAVLASPFVALAVAGLVAVVHAGGVSPRAAWAWGAQHRGRWLPYVLGVTAAVALLQVVPIVLSVTVGLTAASTYRAGELAFGVTNLLIGVVVQTQLTQDAPDLRRTYRGCAAALLAVAVVNGALVGLIPLAVLQALLGPVADDLQEVVLPFTFLRAALGPASVGAVLLVRRLSPRVVGLLGAASAFLSAIGLVAGAVVGGLTGGVAGLAVAELSIAVGYYQLLRRRT